MAETITDSTPRAVEATATREALSLVLDDGRTLTLPWHCAPRRLCHAAPAGRMRAELVFGGYAIDWPLIAVSMWVDGLVRDFPEFITPATVTIDTDGGS